MPCEYFLSDGHFCQRTTMASAWLASTRAVVTPDLGLSPERGLETGVYKSVYCVFMSPLIEVQICRFSINRIVQYFSKGSYIRLQMLARCIHKIP